MATKVQIFNRALYLLKQGRVTNPATAVELTDVFDSIRDEVLEDAPWNFAKTWVTVASDASAGSWQYAYSYTLPASPWCLAVQHLEDVEAKWQVGAGRKLHTDEGPPLKFAYTARITDETRFAGQFTGALAVRLALEVGGQVGDVSTARLTFLEKRYDRLISAARTRDGQEGHHLEIVADDYLASRI